MAFFGFGLSRRMKNMRMRMRMRMNDFLLDGYGWRICRTHRILVLSMVVASREWLFLWHACTDGDPLGVMVHNTFWGESFSALVDC